MFSELINVGSKNNTLYNVDAFEFNLQDIKDNSRSGLKAECVFWDDRDRYDIASISLTCLTIDIM